LAPGYDLADWRCPKIITFQPCCTRFRRLTVPCGRRAAWNDIAWKNWPIPDRAMKPAGICRYRELQNVILEIIFFDDVF
jgi:hypothetical protein